MIKALNSKNVWILTASQALMMSASSFIVFAGGIIGSELAPREILSTLPVASLIVGTAISTIPVTRMMQKLGRKKAFLLFAFIGICSSLLASYSIYQQYFILFCVSTTLMGVMMASVNHFRFAAMESVSEKDMPRAASTVLLGGIAAAFIGPEVADTGKKILSVDFSGSFIILGILFSLGFIILLFFKNVEAQEKTINSSGRPLVKIIKQPVFWVAVGGAMFGYAIMSFIMTATPVSMHVMDGHSLHHTKWVIQSHIIFMFIPSLIVPFVISRIGVIKMMYTGLGAFGICILIALGGHLLWNYWVSLILLGIGWNFLFIGGTTLLPHAYKENEKFKVLALNEFVVFSSQAVAALSAGYVVTHLGWEAVLLINIPIILIPIGALIKYQLLNKA